MGFGTFRFLGLFTLFFAVTSPASDLSTIAEKSGWTKTGRYDEVMRLCQAFENDFRGKVRCQTFGTTPENRPMLALVLSHDGLLDAKANRAAHRPVVLFQGGI